MSTKFTIACGERWHLWSDLADDSIWLETAGHSFRADQFGVQMELGREVVAAIAQAWAEKRFPEPDDENL